MSKDEKKHVKHINGREMIPLDHVLSKFTQQNREIIKQLDKEEELERMVKPMDSPEGIINEKMALIHSNDLKRKEFIGELKSGLGEQLKKNPNKLTKIEKPTKVKITDFFKKLFTRF